MLSLSRPNPTLTTVLHRSRSYLLFIPLPSVAPVLRHGTGFPLLYGVGNSAHHSESMVVLGLF